MKKLVFYSDQIIEENKRIDEKMISLISNKKAKFGYIPSSGDPDRTYFQAQVQYYRHYGIDHFVFFDLEEEYDPNQIGELLTCDVIHLSGGDPIRFLNNIKNRQFLSVLREYVHNGGILIGVSGGAVQFGKNAGLYKVFISNVEEAIQSLPQLTTLGLVDFEFLPHYNRWDAQFKQAVMEYSKQTGAVIYACNDGDGIIVVGDHIELIGRVIKIEKGVETTL